MQIDEEYDEGWLAAAKEELRDCCDYCYQAHDITECAELLKLTRSLQRNAIDNTCLCLICLEVYAELCKMITCENHDACNESPDPHPKVLKCGVRLRLRT